MITAQYLLQEMGLDNNCTFHPTEDQLTRLEQLVADPSVQALTEEEVEIVVAGEEGEQMTIACRSMALAALHSLLGEIFNEG